MKIIVLTSKFGMGHYSAAKTLTEHLQQAVPHHQTYLADFYQIAFPNHFQTIYKSYTRLMLHGGKLVNSANKSITNDEQGLPKSLKLPEQFLLHRLSSYLDQEQPDIVITTYSFASYLVSEYKRLHQGACSHITCITDIGVHNVWVNPDTSFYLVACEETKNALLKRGVDEKDIAISGIPISPAFHPINQAAKRQKKKELLLMGGGLGMLPETKSFYKSLSDIPNLHTTIVCGKNNRLKEKLVAADLPHLTILGCIDDVAQRMAQADIFLTKRGGISTFEAIGAELPLLLFPPTLEQEIKNCNFIVRNGLGKQLSGKPSSYAEQIAFLINNELKLADIRHSMHRFRMHFDTDAVIDFIMKEEGRMQERRAV